MPNRSAGRKAFRSATIRQAGSALETVRRAEPAGREPDWRAVEELLALLADTRAVFPTAVARSSWISAYEPGRRLMLESGRHSSWVQVEHIRACWRTFEEQRRVCREDVLEPGRRSAFMMALFEQVRGVLREEGDDRYLVLAGTPEGG